MHGIVTTAVGATAGSTDSAYPLPAARDRNERAAGVTGAASGQPGNGQTASLGSSPGGGTRGTGIIFSYQVLTGRSYNIAYATFEQSGDTGAGGLTIQSPFDGSNPSQATPGTFNAGATMRGDAAGHPAGATGATRPGFAATIPDRTAPGSLPGAAFLEPQDQTLGYSAQLLDGLAPSHWFSPTATTGTGGGTAFTTAHTLGCPMTPTGSSLVPAPGMVSASTPSAVGATAALTDVLYLQEAGNSSLISVYDINQGQIGDCFLLSSIGEIALWHPSAIMSMIQANANGTETVTLHLAANGSLPTFGTTSFETVSITVSNTFPSDAVNNGATQDVANGEKEIWVQVLEKAVATLGGGYNSIANGGNPMIAMEELTGQAATSMSPGSLTVQDLQSDMAAGDLIVMDTASSGSLPYGLYNDHAYMFESVTTVGGTPMVQLLNPWGFDEPSAIPLSQLSQGIVEVDIGQFVNNQDITGTSGNDTITLTYDLDQRLRRPRRGERHPHPGQRHQLRDRHQHRDHHRRQRQRHHHPGRRHGQRLDRPRLRQRHADPGHLRPCRDHRQHGNHHRRFRQRHRHPGDRADDRHVGRSRRRGQQAHSRQCRQHRFRGQRQHLDRRCRQRRDHPWHRGRQRLHRSGRRQRLPDPGQRNQRRDRRQYRDHHRRHRQRQHHAEHAADRQHAGGPRRRRQQADPGQWRQYGDRRQRRNADRRHRRRRHHAAHRCDRWQRQPRQRGEQANPRRRRQHADGLECAVDRRGRRGRHRHARDRSDGCQHQPGGRRQQRHLRQLHQHRHGFQCRDDRRRVGQRHHHTRQRADRRDADRPRCREEHADPWQRHQYRHGRQRQHADRWHRQRIPSPWPPPWPGAASTWAPAPIR